ncbi:MAG: hypothetical protein V3T17_10175 [Pseudomonadales bacterium]
MNTAQRILLLTGGFLITCTMIFGVGYALFDEHQTLQGIGFNLAGGFIEAAQGNMDAAFAKLDAYAALNAEYGYEVHSHGHWGMLSLILMILGLIFPRLTVTEKQGLILAWGLALSAALFPLGVLMQIGPAAAIGKILAIIGSTGMVLGLLVAAWALLREPV